jgi:colanic acid biosynthesis glycosyl transferase WcaI
MGMHYKPEPSGNAPYTAGLAEGLVRSEHTVSMLTGYPHYPAWERQAGYTGWGRTEEINGVSVHRLNHYVPRRPRGLARLWLEVSFGLRLIGTKWPRADVRVLVSPALFSTSIALLRARRPARSADSRVPVVIWVQDLYSLGMTETAASGSFVAHLMAAVESRALRSADGVVVIHDRFRAHLIKHLGVAPERVTVIRNWTHLTPFVLENRAAARSSFGWEPGDIIVLHAGNMGAKQGLENVVEAARLADQQSSFVRFVLLGDGNQRARLQKLAEGIDRIEFMESLPGTRFQEALAAADVLLVNELPGVKEMSVPSKLTSYFSSGVPVLAATDDGSVTAEEIATADAGLRVDAGTPNALVHGAELLGSDEELSRRFSDNGRRFMESTLSEEHAIDTYDRYLTHLAAGSHPDTRQKHPGEHHA